MNSTDSVNISRDIAATLLATVLVTVLLYVLTLLTKNKVIDPKLCRKIIHTISAPCFMFVWPLYSSSQLTTRILASLLPLFQLERLILSAKATKLKSNSTIVQNKNTNDFNLADAISRSGDRYEAFGGPLIYIIVVYFITLFHFRTSPMGIITLCQLAVGDGLADIIGRNLGRIKWPGMKHKSIAGTLAFIIGSFLITILLLKWLVYTQCMNFNFTTHITTIIIIISIICGIVELLPLGIDDNILVPCIAYILSYLLL